MLCARAARLNGIALPIDFDEQLFVLWEKSKDLSDWCYCLFSDARLQVPITHHPCSVISINYDKKVIYTTRMALFSYKHSIKFGMLAESQANITYYSCYLVHLGLHFQARRFVTA